MNEVLVVEAMVGEKRYANKFLLGKTMNRNDFEVFWEYELREMLGDEAEFTLNSWIEKEGTQ